MKREIEDIYPLSPMQQGMLYHSVSEKASGVYFEQSCWILHGELDVPAFERSWQNVVRRHAALRSAFIWEDVEEPLQVVYRDVPLSLQTEDWQGFSVAEQETRLNDFLAMDRRRGFSLGDAPLMRLALLRSGDAKNYFVWSHHHLLMDGWSLPIVVKDFLDFYQAARGDSVPRLPQPRPYRDYIAWLRQQDKERAREFWTSAVGDFEVPLSLPSELDVENGTETAEYDTARTLLSEVLSGALEGFAREHGLTANTVFQGALALLLSKYCGSDDVVFGVTVSGRPPTLEGADTLVGLFINTLPLRVRVGRRVRVLDFLRRIQERASEMRQFEHTSLIDVHGWTSVPRTTPLFEALLVVENYPIDKALRGKSSPLMLERGSHFTRTNYPLTLAISPSAQIGLEVGYDARRFRREFVDKLLLHFRTILEGFIARSSEPLSAVSLLTDDERNRLTRAAPETRRGSDTFMSVPRLFDEAVAGYPGHPAIVTESAAVTYDALGQWTNRLSRTLAGNGVTAESVVATYLPRSAEAIAVHLGVLRAGAAYLPLDIDAPPERTRQILTESGAGLVITDATYGESLVNVGVRKLLLEEIEKTRDEGHVVSKTAGIDCESAAYVLYTSGSSGTPKGVVVRHGGLANHTLHVRARLQLGPADRVLQFLSLGFDASGEEIFPALVSGAAIVMHPGPATYGIRETLELCERHGVSILHLPAAYWGKLADEVIAGRLALPETVRAVVVGGESLSRARVNGWMRATGERVPMINAYGPTETTISATMHNIVTAEVGPVPIGRPIDNVVAYVLDHQQDPLPVGIPGEVYIGGMGVARGYAGRPDLTAERFLPDPFALRAGARVYRTGDRAQYRADGTLEFLGRLDRQVKVRGYRIEPGELEAKLAEHPGVRDCAVLACQDPAGETALVAYVVARAQGAVNGEGLRSFLAGRVPQSMLPSLFQLLEAFPFTPGGKIDRRKLPAPDWSGEKTRDHGAVLLTPTEDLLVGIWRGILGASSVHRGDNFFALGGHSLRAMQLLSRVRDVFGVDLPLATVFEAPVLSALAQRIDAARTRRAASEMPPIARRERGGEILLSFAQQRLWFIDQLEPGGTFYNIPAAFKITGSLDQGILIDCIRQIVRRHEVLRSTFDSTEGRPHVVISDDNSIVVPVVDLTAGASADEEIRRIAREEAGKAFNLRTGPLYRVLLLKLRPEVHVLLLTMHHIVSDGWSMGLMVREVATLYQATSVGKPSPLADLDVQYSDYASWQREWLVGPELQRQTSYWKAQLAGVPPVLELPTDRARPSVQTFGGAQHRVIVPRDVRQAVSEICAEEGATPFMTLLAVFVTLLSKYSQSMDISVGSPIAGRRHTQVENVIGFFVNTLVLRTRFDANETFRSLLRKVRETTLLAFDHQDLPFEKLVEEIHPVRDLSSSPLIQVMFVMQNMPWQRIQVPGLLLESLETETLTSSYDLSLVVQEAEGGYLFEFQYKTDLFNPSTIARMGRHLRLLLSELLSGPDIQIAALDLVTAEEREELARWNATAAAFPDTLTVHEWFELVAAQHPETVAAAFAPRASSDGELRTITYHELNARANQIARRLRTLGVRCESPVGVCLDRTLDMVAAVLGILKAGGAFVPMDPLYPADRLAYMMSDSGVRVVVTTEGVGRSLPATAVALVRLDSEWETIARLESENLGHDVDPENLAYVIYTSGSTGRPKGTMLRHRGLCNLATVQTRAFDLGVGSRVLQFASLSFDASVWEMVMSLLSGATLYLTSGEVISSPRDLAELMEKEKITTATLPPSILSLLPPISLPDLRVLVTAGERCPVELVDRWSGGRKFFNAYGPTETTVCASMHLCAGEHPQAPPIGTPIANFELFIVDRFLRRVPVGIPGELCVGGVGLARGYLGRPDLTAEKFVPHPWSGTPGARLYRTGDVCRLREDGAVEFLGRIDEQVKLRGFRIELGEIEAVILDQEDVREACVMVREDRPGEQRIVAYVVPVEGGNLQVPELRSYLRERLPEYMVPSFVVVLDALPLTASKKVDRRMLPAPSQERADFVMPYEPPRNEQERVLVEISRELLGVEQVGIHDNFFDLGGHSLLATQFVSRVRNTLGVDLPLRALFERPSIAELALEIERQHQAGSAPVAATIKKVSREAARVKRSEIME